jgi:hypothetical protein
VLGDKSNLRFEKNILVIARDFIDLQAASSAFTPTRSRIAQLTKGLVI